MTTAITTVADINTALATATTIDAVRAVEFDAETARRQALAVRDPKAEAEAIAKKMLAARRLGETLQVLLKKGRPKKGSPPTTISLEEIGVTKKQSARAQRFARMLEEEFRDHIAVVCEKIAARTAKLVGIDDEPAKPKEPKKRKPLSSTAPGFLESLETVPDDEWGEFIDTDLLPKIMAAIGAPAAFDAIGAGPFWRLLEDDQRKALVAASKASEPNANSVV